MFVGLAEPGALGARRRVRSSGPGPRGSAGRADGLHHGSSVPICFFRPRPWGSSETRGSGLMRAPEQAPLSTRHWTPGPPATSQDRP